MHRISSNKEIIQKINECFFSRESSACDVSQCDGIDGSIGDVDAAPPLFGWKAPKMSDLAAFPDITISQVIEDGDTLVVEGTVSGTTCSGSPYFARYCDIYQIRGGRIHELASFVVESDPAEQS